MRMGFEPAHDIHDDVGHARDARAHRESCACTRETCARRARGLGRTVVAWRGMCYGYFCVRVRVVCQQSRRAWARVGGARARVRARAGARARVRAFFVCACVVRGVDAVMMMMMM